MTPEQVEQERAAFEAWARDAFPGLDLVKLAHKGEIVGFTEPTTIKMFAAWLERAKQNRWISVEESKPDDEETPVLVYPDLKKRPNEKYCRPEISHYDLDDDTFQGDDTIGWWMPLPLPPEGEAA